MSESGGEKKSAVGTRTGRVSIAMGLGLSMNLLTYIVVEGSGRRESGNVLDIR